MPNPPSRDDDESFMARALALASLGEGSVEPNPLVGCVLVRDGHVIGEGYHQRYGGPHAEIVALEQAGLPPCRPQGAYYVLADVSRLPGQTSRERVMELLHRTGVAAVPGQAFFRGEEGNSLARFCFGKTDADLANACERLRRL